LCSLLEACIRIMIVFLAVIILKIFFDIFFRSRKLNIIIFINWICYIIWQVILSKNNALPGYVNIAISIFLMSIICIFSYEGSFLQKIVFSLLINVMWMLIEFLVGYIFVVCEINIYYRIPQVVGSLVSKLLMLILILVLRRFFINENIITIPNKYHMLLLTIPIGSMFVVYNIFAICLLTNNKKYIGVSFASSILVLAINIIMFRLYMILSKEKELQKFNTVYEQQLELCNQHMREKESVMMSARNIKHDIRQHFIVLIELLDKNENDVAISYLKKLIDMNILNSDGICKSGNIVVDSLINAKYTVASNLKIKFDIDIHIPIQLSFESADISILLGNILVHRIINNWPN
jgi:two-component system sensor histidine kinase AgrC